MGWVKVDEQGVRARNSGMHASWLWRSMGSGKCTFCIS